MKKIPWIIVTNKWTYLLLLSIPIGLGKILIYDIPEKNVGEIFISLMIVIIGIYFFVRFNSYSAWMNPDHPKPKNDHN